MERFSDTTLHLHTKVSLESETRFFGKRSGRTGFLDIPTITLHLHTNVVSCALNHHTKEVISNVATGHPS